MDEHEQEQEQEQRHGYGYGIGDETDGTGGRVDGTIT